MIGVRGPSRRAARRRQWCRGSPSAGDDDTGGDVVRLLAEKVRAWSWLAATNVCRSRRCPGAEPAGEGARSTACTHWC